MGEVRDGKFNTQFANIHAVSTCFWEVWICVSEKTRKKGCYELSIKKISKNVLTWYVDLLCDIYSFKIIKSLPCASVKITIWFLFYQGWWLLQSYQTHAHLSKNVQAKPSHWFWLTVTCSSKVIMEISESYKLSDLSTTFFRRVYTATLIRFVAVLRFVVFCVFFGKFPWRFMRG